MPCTLRALFSYHYPAEHRPTSSLHLPHTCSWGISTSVRRMFSAPKSSPHPISYCTRLCKECNRDRLSVPSLRSFQFPPGQTTRRTHTPSPVEKRLRYARHARIWNLIKKARPPRLRPEKMPFCETWC